MDRRKDKKETFNAVEFKSNKPDSPHYVPDQPGGKTRRNRGTRATGNVPDNPPNPEDTNDTGFQGTTNSLSKDRRDAEGYGIAIEDTMIGYDGSDPDQMTMDLRKDPKNVHSKNTRGVDDND
ncbi:MAG TPA: hypothetical protein VGE15_06590 [Sphingobacteriaceae bacterium]